MILQNYGSDIDGETRAGIAAHPPTMVSVATLAMRGRRPAVPCPPRAWRAPVLPAQHADDIVGLFQDRRGDLARARGAALQDAVDFCRVVHQARHLR